MKTVLILEDDFDLAMDWKSHLEEREFAVIHTSTSEQAIEVLNDRAVDLIITDVLIKEDGGTGKLKKTGGLSLLSHILLKVEPKPAIIAVSGAHPNLNVLKHAKSLHADRVMVKPFSAQSLADIVEDLLV